MYGSLLNTPGSLFSQLELLRRELDEAFGIPGLPSSIRSVSPGTSPAINVGRTPTSVEVYAFVPGLDASKVDVTLDRGVLHIAGERASDIPDKDAPVQRVRGYVGHHLAGRYAGRVCAFQSRPMLSRAGSRSR
jgi:HSP20 family protein